MADKRTVDAVLFPRFELLGVFGPVAQGTEYEWHRDASWDPFARLAGLV